MSSVNLILICHVICCNYDFIWSTWLGVPVYQYGAAHRNTISWSPHGRFLCVAGFGNLAGEMDFYDTLRSKKIGEWKKCVFDKVSFLQFLMCCLRQFFFWNICLVYICT